MDCGARQGSGASALSVPDEIDDTIARVKLKAMGLSIDTLTPEQKSYLSGWEV